VSGHPLVSSITNFRTQAFGGEEVHDELVVLSEWPHNEWEISLQVLKDEILFVAIYAPQHDMDARSFFGINASNLGKDGECLCCRSITAAAGTVWGSSSISIPEPQLGFKDKKVKYYLALIPHFALELSLHNILAVVIHYFTSFLGFLLAHTLYTGN